VRSFWFIAATKCPHSSSADTGLTAAGLHLLGSLLLEPLEQLCKVPTAYVCSIFIRAHCTCISSSNLSQSSS